MNAPSNDTERGKNAMAIDIWENEGCSPSQESMDHQYGRRIEADRSWTVYHVFTGVPAHIAGEDMVGLSRSEATANMLSLNFRSIERRKVRIPLPSSALNAREASARQS